MECDLFIGKLINYRVPFGGFSALLLTEMKMLSRFSPTHRDEDVEQVLQRGKLGDELLHHLAERLEDGVVVDTGQVEAERHKKKQEVW